MLRRLPLLAVGALGLALLPTLPAQAAISTPANGTVVSGLVTIDEARGGTNDCSLSNPAKSRMEVSRIADGATVFTATHSGTGAWNATWNSVGQPLGQYRLRTWATDGKKSGFLNLGCTTQPEALLSDYTVTLRNRASVALALPAHVTTGESLPVTVRTAVEATGVSNTPAPNRQVTVTVPGVGEQTVTTDDQGSAQTTFDLPDLPAGPLTATAEVADDATYLGGSGSEATTLDRRITGTIYTGATRAQPGTRAALAGQLIDLTPGSARMGRPIVDQDLRLSLGDDSGVVSTTADGRAIRTVPVSGQSRAIDAAAAYAGSEVWEPSSDTVTFYVGDAAAPEAPTEHSTTGGYTRYVGSLLQRLLAPVSGGLDPLSGASPLTVQRLIDTLLGGTAPELGALADANLLHLADPDQLRNLLDSLLGTVGDTVGRSGDPVDVTIDKVFTGLAKRSTVVQLADAARFEWRAVYLTPGGDQRAREFGAVIGVPQPLDVTGDGTPDVLAAVTLAEGFTVPRLEVARLAGAPADLPLSLQAVLALPGESNVYRFGYDTRRSNAPVKFRADVALGDGGAALEVAASSDAAVAVTGAITQPDSTTTPAPSAGEPATLGGDGPAVSKPAPAEQRFGATFDPAPTAARLGIDLAGGAAGGQDIAATLQTDRPTKVGIQLADDSGGDQVFLADATLDSVDGSLSIALHGTDETGLTATMKADRGLDSVSVRARSLEAGRTASDIVLGLTEVPDTIEFGLGADGAGTMSASGPIGDFQAGYSTNGPIALLDDPAYLRMLSKGDHESVALRLPGFEGMSLNLGDTVSLGLTMAPTPLHALVDQDGLTLDAQITDAPHQVSLALSPDGNVRIEGSDPMERVEITATDPSGILMGATDLAVSLTDIPKMLSVEVGDAGATFDTGNQPIGLMEITAGSGQPVSVPGEGDGLLLSQSEESVELAARIHGLRKIRADLSGTPDIMLDTVAGEVFDIKLRSPGGGGLGNVDATIDHLVPNLHLGLVDDGSGAMRLNYKADEPTNSLTFEMGGLRGSMASPLPARLDVCMADDEACLPTLGIENPALGSVQLDASEYTTLNLVDPGSGMTATNLRLQRLDLTGDLDIDNGGPVYLNTTVFDGDCGFAGCEQPIQGGTISADLGSASLVFTPGNGFSAVDARTDLVPTKLLGQTTGVRATGGTGIVRCVSGTSLKVTVKVIGLPITLDLKDAICNVPNRTPRVPPQAD